MVDFNNPIVIEEEFGEYDVTDKHVISRSPIETVFRTAAVARFWHALAGLYL